MNGRPTKGAAEKTAMWSKVQAEELTLNFSSPLPAPTRNAECPGRRRK